MRLTAALADFIPRFTSMSVAARDAQNRPFVGRALGCRVSADRCRLTVFLSASREGELLECLRQNGAIALTVTRPTTHQTFQFKGKVTSLSPHGIKDRAEIAAYRQSFIEELQSLGYEPAFTHTLVSGGDDAVAVVFEPAVVYDQTPGPRAGAMLEEHP